MIESPTDQLRHEHELVLMVVEAMEREAADIERSGHVHAERVEQMVDFTRNFTDGCHHHKEEEALFPALEERSAAAGGPVSVMLSEHEAGRDAIRAIADALRHANDDASARATVLENLGLYAYLLRLHINKENAVLFPLAERTLSDQEQELLAEEFERIEEETGAGVHERYHRLAHDLATAPVD
jgi:hemerythrin-like domain-containing protein